MRVTCTLRLQNLRRRKHFTQKYVAGHLGISPRTYCDYEHGRRHIPLHQLVALAQFYNVDLNYIAGVSNMRRDFPSN